MSFRAVEQRVNDQGIGRWVVCHCLLGVEMEVVAGPYLSRSTAEAVADALNPETQETPPA